MLDAAIVCYLFISHCFTKSLDTKRGSTRAQRAARCYSVTTIHVLPHTSNVRHESRERYDVVSPQYTGSNLTKVTFLASHVSGMM